MTEHTRTSLVFNTMSEHAGTLSLATNTKHLQLAAWYYMPTKRRLCVLHLVAQASGDVDALTRLLMVACCTQGTPPRTCSSLFGGYM
jgi:hypothetical protein